MMESLGTVRLDRLKACLVIDGHDGAHIAVPMEGAAALVLNIEAAVFDYERARHRLGVAWRDDPIPRGVHAASVSEVAGKDDLILTFEQDNAGKIAVQISRSTALNLAQRILRSIPRSAQ